MFTPNPYIAGNPVVSDEKLIGRKRLVRDIERVLEHPSTHAIVLYGQRRIGKTSVLLHLEHNLLRRHEYLPVYVDVQEYVYANISVESMLYGIAQKIALQTHSRLPQKRRFDPQGHFFRDIFVPVILSFGKRRGLVVLFDEFDMLKSHGSSSTYYLVLRSIRDWFNKTNALQCVFVLGRHPADLSPDLLALFKSFPARRISLLTQEESLTIVRQSELDGSLAWTEDASKLVWYWTRGHPFFTQLLCCEVWDICQSRAEPLRPPPVGVDDVKEALKLALERSDNQFQWLWNSFSSAERLVTAAIASVSDEYVTREMLRDILTEHKIVLMMREIELAPENLLRWDILCQANEGLCFAIPLFRLWVKSEKTLTRVKNESDRFELPSEQLCHFQEQ
ncbi:hypothetical protein CSB45_11920 [candidate division KSB3 bacterium]|uniref:ATPase domain-containing protein n=1 Tax=candidate division KSB3 bacterium TaxID=2044937 RepID=A0A2G6E2Q2_9BACT|nr:MAG: hypothetical protein CSB45_11920 [candidate division KSB3 bacterium]PIE29238.1 MAG: hypothetical protein CSA57_09530 [candidate division KSB3 bacterium]